MKHIDSSEPRMTSVTLRSSTRKLVKIGLKRLEPIAGEVSEQRLMRECIRIMLRLWRGRGRIAMRNKRYNQRKGPFEIVPFCTTEALRSVSWARCHHAGVSFSRLMDFAIETYLERVIEEFLSAGFYWRDKSDVDFWRQRFSLRKHTAPFIISYYSRTRTNNGVLLQYEEKSQIRFLTDHKTNAA
ncbi:MAG: hypothetical protein U1F27_04040 [Turneriella sp.]